VESHMGAGTRVIVCLPSAHRNLPNTRTRIGPRKQI
jgi:hypothetical protein